MGQLIVRYRQGNEIRWGRLTGAAPLSAADSVTLAPLIVDVQTTAAFLAAHSARTLEEEEVIEISGDQLLSPVTSDGSIYAQGLNYKEHAAEAQHAKRTSNLIFGKASSTLTGPYGEIVRPAEVELLDYEVEFGILLRRDLGEGDVVTEEMIGDAVAGVVLCNDVSARDTMFGTSFLQWFRGKSYRTFCPTGPVLWLLDPAEVAEALRHLDIQLWVNGELRQSASSDQLIFRPAETLSYIASSMDMKRGDLLLTGTPGGVTAPATLRMVEILKENLLADEARRDALRIEMTKGRPFLQPGDIVTATLADNRGLALVGIANRIVDAR
ncbi:fumarylacetoacetate hydrolase family protein [Sphingobium sp. EM0848]|uniref:fumarylacetoacetate hydrolase family protein n=1 Tax=Sphingobium sp. EM0848 TaxID=2743473 RepID=UPI00159C2A51|nr:fumarylacetoacetate hydrolase family protein [Sphingobium sp. EM0848]